MLGIAIKMEKLLREMLCGFSTDTGIKSMIPQLHIRGDILYIFHLPNGKLVPNFGAPLFFLEYFRSYTVILAKAMA